MTHEGVKGVHFCEDYRCAFRTPSIRIPKWITMRKRSAIKGAKDDPTPLNNEDAFPPKNKKKDCYVQEEPESNNTSWLFDLPDEVLLRNIIPFIGDYQYRFVGLVNHDLHDAYVKVYPKKQTYYSTLTKEHIKICYEENHCLHRSPCYFPFWRRKGIWI
jgi:hypothetical protein